MPPERQPLTQKNQAIYKGPKGQNIQMRAEGPPPKAPKCLSTHLNQNASDRGPAFQS